jgi:hypothetical protein
VKNTYFQDFSIRLPARFQQELHLPSQIAEYHQNEVTVFAPRTLHFEYSAVHGSTPPPLSCPVYAPAQEHRKHTGTSRRINLNLGLVHPVAIVFQQKSQVNFLC